MIEVKPTERMRQAKLRRSERAAVRARCPGRIGLRPADATRGTPDFRETDDLIDPNAPKSPTSAGRWRRHVDQASPGDRRNGALANNGRMPEWCPGRHRIVAITD